MPSVEHQRALRLLAAVTVPAVAFLWPAGTPAGRAGGTCRGEPVTIIGSDGADHISGTAGPDVIGGLGGDDMIHGGGGDDVICGDAGDDRIDGGGGDDTCDGGAGKDAAEACESTLSTP